MVVGRNGQLERRLLRGHALLVRGPRCEVAGRQRGAARARTAPSKHAGRAAAGRRAPRMAAASSAAIGAATVGRGRGPSVITWPTFWSANASHERRRASRSGSSATSCGTCCSDVDVPAAIVRGAERARARRASPTPARGRRARCCGRRSTPPTRVLPVEAGDGGRHRAAGQIDRERLDRSGRERASTPRGDELRVAGGHEDRGAIGRRAEHGVGARRGVRERAGVAGRLSLTSAGSSSCTHSAPAARSDGEQLGVHRAAGRRGG